MIRIMSFFQKNITTKGRWTRAIFALAFTAAAIALYNHSKLLAALCFAVSAFCLFESLQSWCLLRACGIKTRI
jgi:hypothetical protein